MNIDIGICSDAKSFIKVLNESLEESLLPDTKEWLNQIFIWKKKYPVINNGTYDPYNFFRDLSKICNDNDNIVLDTGCVVAWAMQAFRFKENQKLMHDWNNTAMGWALPASIGAYFANKNRTICIAGDGSMQMNIQELATIQRHNLPIKIIVFNNQGHSMIKQTQEQWFGSNYIASSVEGGLPLVDFCAVGKAYGINSFRRNLDKDIFDFMPSFLNLEGSTLLDVKVDPDSRVKTQVKFGRPLEDMEPLLPREEFSSNMIIEEI